MEPASTSDGKFSCYQGHSFVRHIVPQLDNLYLELFGEQVDFKEVGLNLLIYEILDNIGPKSCQLSISSGKGGCICKDCSSKSQLWRQFHSTYWSQDTGADSLEDRQGQ